MQKNKSYLIKTLQYTLSLSLVLSVLFFLGCATPPKTKKPNDNLVEGFKYGSTKFEYIRNDIQENSNLNDYDALVKRSNKEWGKSSIQDKISIEYVLWSVFKNIPTKKLKKLITENVNSNSTEDLDDWLRMALAWKENKGIYKISAVKKNIDFAKKPEHFASLNKNFWRNELPANINHIALFLPLSGKYKSLSLQIRNGIIKHILSKHPELTLTIYDTKEHTDIIELYHQAKKNGANVIIGPLMKSNIKKIKDINASDIITLNRIDSSLAYTQFSFSVLTEARQINNILSAQNYRRIGILSSDNSVDIRLANSLTEQWNSQAGNYSDIKKYSYKRPKLRKALGSLIHENESKSRMNILKWVLKKDLNFYPRIRKDIEAVVLIGNRKHVAVFAPQFKFFNLKVPIYSTSKLTPKNFNKNIKTKDLNNVIFPTMPAAIYTSKVNTQFEAFGWDSIEIALNKHLLATDLCLNTGLSGHLQIDENGWVNKQLVWAKFNLRGTPISWKPKYNQSNTPKDNSLIYSNFPVMEYDF